MISGIPFSPYALYILIMKIVKWKRLETFLVPTVNFFAFQGMLHQLVRDSYMRDDGDEITRCGS